MARLKSMYRLLFLCVVTSCVSVCAQQVISGSQSGTLGPGEYLVTGGITVSSGSTLTVKPGTKFFHNGNHTWEISGELRAEGAREDSIYFIRKDAVEGHRWGGIRFKSGAPASVLDYCVIDYCYMPDYNGPSSSIMVNSTELTLKHSRVSNAACNNDFGGVYAKSSVILIDSCLIVNNKAVNHPKGMGVFLDNCDNAKILHSVIAFNKSGGA